MKWFNNLRIGAKLGFAFGLLMMLVGMVGLTAISRMNQLHTIADAIANDPLPGSAMAGEITSDIKQFRLFEFRYVLTNDKAEMGKLDGMLSGKAGEIVKDFSDYEKTISNEEDRKYFNTLKDQWTKYQEPHEALLTLARQNKDQEADKLISGPMYEQFTAIGDTLAKIVEFNKADGKRLATEASVAYQSGRKQALTVLFVAIVIGVFGGWFITRRIAGPLHEITAAATELSVGNVEQTIRIQTRDEIGKVADAFRSLIAFQREMASVATAMAAGDLTSSLQAKSEADVLGNAFVTMVGSLRTLIGELAKSADSVASASTELTSAAQQTGQAANEIAATIQEVAQAAGQSAQTSQEMAKGSEQQARTATEATAAMERLSSAIAQVQQGGARAKHAAEQADQGMKEASRAVEEVARSSQQMAQAAEQASSVAKSGGKAVEQTVASMQRIQSQVASSTEKVRELDQKGQEIGAIVETIDQIAEQTNLLALNAAIEAARAGEHGKGFAVVADEVRKLAERSAGATKEIGALIASVRQDVNEVVKAMQESNSEVTDGAAKSREAGEALEQILAAATKVAEEVEGVSAIAEEMTASVEEVLATVETVRLVAEEQEKAVTEMAAGSAQVSSSITTVASISEETAAGAEEMSASAEEVSASAQNVSAAVEEQTASVEQVSAAASQLNEMAQRLQELVGRFRISETSDRSDELHTFKEAHMRWVHRVEAMLNGGPAIEKHELISHRDCAFGKWYDSLGRRDFGHTSTYKALEAPHAKVHQLAREAVEAMGQRNMPLAARKLEEMRTASGEVVRLLDRLGTESTIRLAA